MAVLPDEADRACLLAHAAAVGLHLHEGARTRTVLKKIVVFIVWSHCSNENDVHPVSAESELSHLRAKF